MADLGRRMAQWTLRNNRRRRWRIYRKLQGMLNMNEALSRSLERLWYNYSEMGKKPDRAEAIALQEWLSRDRAGDSLSDAMSGWVPVAELYMIRSGEESGTVSKSFSAIMSIGEQARKMKEAIIYAVSYPFFMLLLLSAVLFMFGYVLIDKMKTLASKAVLESMGGLVMVSDYIHNYGIWTLLGLFAIMAVIASTLPHWRGSLRVKLDKFPPWSWYRVWQGSAFLLGISSLLGAQVPLKRALEILEEEATPWLQERLSTARQEVLRGRNLGEALRAGNFGFPDPMVALDLEILSERGDVGTVIEQITHEWIEEQVIELQNQANVARFGGMVLVAGVIVWAMLSIMHATVVLSTTQSQGGGMGGGG